MDSAFCRTISSYPWVHSSIQHLHSLLSWRSSNARSPRAIRVSLNAPSLRNTSVRLGSSGAPSSSRARISGKTVSAAFAERCSSNTLPSCGDAYPHLIVMVALGPFGSWAPVTSQVYRANSGILGWMICFIDRFSSEAGKDATPL